MGEIWEDRRVSQRWHRMGKNKKIPERLRQGGGRKKAKAKLEVECKISDWFKTKQNKQKKPKPKGMPLGQGMEYKASTCLTWVEENTWPRTPLNILGSGKDWSQSLEVVVSSSNHGV